MNKKKRNRLLAVFMTLVLTFMSVPTTAKANLPTEEPIVKTYHGYVNGVERTIVLTSDTFGLNTYLKIGEGDFQSIASFSKDSVPDRYCANWILNETVLGFWSYDLTPDFDSIVFTLYRSDVASIITLEEPENFIIAVGYKTLSGETYPLPTFDDMKFIQGVDTSIPAPFYASTPDATPIPTQTPELSSPTPIPVVTEPAVLSTPTPVPTVEPTVAPKSNSTTAPKLSIKRSKTTSTIYEGKKVVSKATLKKGTLTWKRWVEKTKRYKTQTYKGVKSSALILKSKNLVYLSKKGVVDIRSYKTGKRIKRFKKVKEIKCVKGSAVRVELINGKKISIKNL